jgi:hypothetical protein
MASRGNLTRTRGGRTRIGLLPWRKIAGQPGAALANSTVPIMAPVSRPLAV